MSENTSITDKSVASDERGFILIVTMLVLVVLTVLCISALDNSNFELQIADNDRQNRVAFNLADGAVYASGKLISETVVDTQDVDYTANNLFYVNIFDPRDGDYSPAIGMADAAAADIDKIANGVDLFHSRVLGFTPLRDVAADGPYDFMLRSASGTGDVFGRIDQRVTENMPGGGIEFASGAAGAGVGAAGGGVAITFDIDIDSFTARNARSQLAVRYRKVLGTAGGL